MIKEEWKAEADRCIDVLKNGGIILYPTDTVWGIGCDARNKDAVARIYALKQRADHKAMLVLLSPDSKLHSFVHDVPEVAWDLLDAASDPLTIIYPNAKGIAENLVGEDGSIAIRIPQKSFCEHLAYRFRQPLVSTSANISGEPTPQSFSEIDERIKNGVDYIVTLERDKRGSKPSSILKIGVKGEIEIVRK